MFSVQTEGGGGSGDVHSSKSRSSICACARVCTCELGSRHCLVQHPLSDLFNPRAAAASCFKREVGGQSHEGQCQTLYFAQTDLVPRSHCMKLARPFILYSKMSFLWAATLTATTILMSRPAPPPGGGRLLQTSWLFFWAPGALGLTRRGRKWVLWLCSAGRTGLRSLVAY